VGVSPRKTSSMRVIECNECGETISAANDEELSQRLAEHLGSEHDEKADEEEIADLVHEQAYDASDS
jgi:predicted small metal-binding protein